MESHKFFERITQYIIWSLMPAAYLLKYSCEVHTVGYLHSLSENQWKLIIRELVIEENNCNHAQPVMPLITSAPEQLVCLADCTHFENDAIVHR